jgi:trans-aconitate 2-methyltransferase
VDAWETEYHHVMDSPESIVGMLKSTGLKPFLDAIEAPREKDEFEAEILAETAKAYPRQRDGKVLFGFKRLFFIAYKG